MNSPLPTEKKYQIPVNVQFSVFLDNRVGQLLGLLDIFHHQPLTVAALSVNEATDHAVVRLLTSNHRLARQLLSDHQLAFSESDILVVELAEQSGLTRLCSLLLNAELNIHYAYPLLVCPHRQPAIALHTDDYHLAGQLLLRGNHKLLGENDLHLPPPHRPPPGESC